MKKSRAEKRWFWLILSLSIVFLYLGYYQLWHHSPRIHSHVYNLHKVLHSHLADIWSVKFSPNENWLASGSVDSTIKIWNRDDGKSFLT
jgi:WD40 repeat protein